MQIVSVERLFCYYAKAASTIEFIDEHRNDSANFARNADFREHRGCDLCIPALRRQYQAAFGKLPRHSPSLFSMDTGFSFSSVGTPRKTPWKFVSGLPSVNPRLSITYSRMVSSCLPVRFLTTEMARRTRPVASK